MIILYTVSAIYHLGAWQGRWHTVFRSLDHANIFLFIAGTYTPICVVLLSGWVRMGMLSTIWALAIIGMTCSIFTLRIPRWIKASLYVGMGWLSVILLPLIVQTISVQPVLVLFGGGVLYTIGAIVYTLRWPNPFPRVFGFHEIFHLFVVAGTTATAVMIWIWVVPFTRS